MWGKEIEKEMKSGKGERRNGREKKNRHLMEATEPVTYIIKGLVKHREQHF